MLSWPETESTLTYTIQIWDKEIHIGDLGIGVRYVWKTLPVRGFTLNGSDSPITIDEPSAVIGGLKWNHTYDFQIFASNGTHTSSASSRIKRDTPLPFIGHQQDHTAQYVKGTAAPAISLGAPAGYDPPTIFSTAFDDAVGAWNSASGSTNEVDFRVCRRSQAPQDYGCGVRADEGLTITFNVEDGGCGYVAACIGGIAHGEALPYTQLADQNGHIKNLPIAIEEPAYYYSTRILWTNDPNVHWNTLKLSKGRIGRFLYLPSTIMHEFGHTLGLHDLYRFGSDYGNYLMGKNDKGRGFPSIPNSDLNYIIDVYENHAPH